LLRGNFLLLLTSSFLFLMSTHLLVPMLPMYLGSIGAVETEIGFIIGLIALTAVLTRIPVGRFIDAHGRRGMLMLGIFLQAASPFLYTVCTDTTQFMVVRVINGLGFAAYAVTAHTMVVDMSPRGRLGEMLGLYSMAFLAAQSVGPSVSGLFLSGLGYMPTFYIAGAVGLGGTALALRIAVPPHTPTVRTGGGFSTVLRNRNLSTASLALAVVLMPHGVIHAFLPLYAAEMGVGPEGVGLYFTVYALSTGIVRPFTGAFSDRVGRVAIAVPSAFLTALGVVVFMLVGDLQGFLLAGALLGFGMGAAMSVLFALAVDTIKPQLRGQGVAVSGTAVDTGISFGAIGMGPVAMQGGYAAAFGATAAVVVAGTVSFLGIRTVWKKDEKTYT